MRSTERPTATACARSSVGADHVAQARPTAWLVWNRARHRRSHRAAADGGVHGHAASRDRNAAGAGRAGDRVWRRNPGIRASHRLALDARARRRDRSRRARSLVPWLATPASADTAARLDRGRGGRRRAGRHHRLGLHTETPTRALLRARGLSRVAAADARTPARPTALSAVDSPPEETGPWPA